MSGMMQVSSSHSAEKTSGHSDIKGFTFYHATVCEYTACLCTTPHYHCQECGLGTSELSHVIAHKNSCLGCRGQDSYGRSASAVNLGTQPPAASDSSSILQDADKSQVYASYGEGSANTNMTLASNSIQTSNGQQTGNLNHFHHRPGLQQSSVFNGFLPTQSQSLYNGMFAAQTFGNQNTYSIAGFNSYGSSIEPTSWLPDNRIMSASSVDCGRGSRHQYADKNVSCSPQGSSHACCGPRINIDNLGLCSPLSSEAYKIVSKEIAGFQNKSGRSVESPSWFCTQSGVSFGTQQNQTSQQVGLYKCNEQFSSCSVSQLNALIHDQTEMKQPNIDAVVVDSFSEAGNQNHFSKQIVKSSCLEQDKLQQQASKYCSLQKNQPDNLSNQHPSHKHGQDNYTTQPSLFNLSGAEIHNDVVYAQVAHVLNMNTENTITKSQAHFTLSKHHSHQQNHAADLSKPFLGIQTQAATAHQPYQEHGRCTIEPTMPCELMENCLQLESKTINENSINFQNTTTNNINNRCQLTLESTNHYNQGNCYPINPQIQKMSENCMQSCAVASGSVLNLGPDGIHQKGCEHNDEEKGSNHESSSNAGESDIIVEETEEEEEVGEDDLTESEISIDELKSCPAEVTAATCLVCNTTVGAVAVASQFVRVSGDLPVTTVSHIPVTSKLSQVVPDDLQSFIALHTEFICRRCFNLIDTVDCLETKLNSVKHDLIRLFGVRVESLKNTESWKIGAVEKKEVGNCLRGEKHTVSSSLTDTLCVPEKQSDDTLVDTYENAVDLNKNDPEAVREECLEKLLLSNNSGSEASVIKNVVVDVLDDSKQDSVPIMNDEDLSDKKYACETCSESFSNKEGVNKHHEQNTKTFSFYCDRCGKGFMMEKGLENHLLLHSGEYRYQCDICGKRFVHHYSLQNHLRKHRGSFRYVCSHCGKGFMCSSSLHIHTRTHTGERPFVCQHCGRMFGCSSNLVAHIRVCSGDLPFHCDKCKKGFALNTQLQAHVLTFHEGQYRFKCPTCGKGFTKQSDQKAHVRTHTREKPHKCSVCDKHYTSTGNLNQHMKQHSDKLPFRCTDCGRGFVRRSALAGHVNTHTGARPHKCDLCDKTFVTRRNLQAHKKWHAGTIKRYTCPVCSKSFNHGLQVHMRTHSGLKPYHCSQCDMSFSVKSSLDKHKKRKHDQIR